MIKIDFDTVENKNDIFRYLLIFCLPSPEKIKRHFQFPEAIGMSSLLKQTCQDGQQNKDDY